MKLKAAMCNTMLLASALALGSAFAQAPTKAIDEPRTPTEGAAPTMKEKVATTTPTTTKTDANAVFKNLDVNKHGYLTRDDLTKDYPNIDFEQADRNKDGRLSKSEFKKAWKQANAASGKTPKATSGTTGMTDKTTGQSPSGSQSPGSAPQAQTGPADSRSPGDQAKPQTPPEPKK